MTERSLSNHLWDNQGNIILGGSSNAYTAQTAESVTGYYEGLRICAKANHTNSGASTLDINGIGATAIRKGATTALAGGEILDDKYYDFIYDATNAVFQLMPAAASVGDVTGPASATDDNLAQFNGTSGKSLEDSGRSITTVGAGKQTIWIPASALYTTGSPSFAILFPGSGLSIPYLAFDPSTSEFAQAFIGMPKGWNEGDLSAQFVWTHPATATNFGVVWRCGFLALGDSDAPGSGGHVSASVTDTGGTTNDIFISSETSAVTPGGSATEGDLMALSVSRNATDGSDTLAVDAFLIGLKILYTTNANTDD